MVTSTSAFEQLVGNTPMVHLLNLSERIGAPVFGKCEFLNPNGSIKDRISLEIINAAERDGLLVPGRSTIVEATGGNTGLAMASIAAQRGYKIIVTLSDKMSEEKIAQLHAWKVETVICPSEVSPTSPEYFINRARDIAADNDDHFFVDQFHNENNIAAHYKGTAREVWRDLDREPQLIVAGAGTGGTLMGFARFCSEHESDTKLVLADPEGSVISTTFNELTPNPQPYEVEGIGGAEVPPLLDLTQLCDAIVVRNEQTLSEQSWMIANEGLFIGGSAACSIAGLVDYARQNPLDKQRPVVVVLCDSGRNYLQSFTAAVGET